jgi:hypothetical protein
VHARLSGRARECGGGPGAITAAHDELGCASRLVARGEPLRAASDVRFRRIAAGNQPERRSPGRDESGWGCVQRRCRFAAEYALANRVQHPLNVNLREDAIIGQVDDWLAREFAPHRLTETVRDLAAVQLSGSSMRADDDQTARKVAECDRKLAQYRAALDAGADPATVAKWITETEAEKASYALLTRPPAPRARMSEAKVKAIVDRLADIAGVLHDANPHDKAEVFRQLGLKLTYHPGRKIVEARVEPVEFGFFDGVRGPTAPKSQYATPLLACEFALDAVAGVGTCASGCGQALTRTSAAGAETAGPRPARCVRPQRHADVYFS